MIKKINIIIVKYGALGDVVRTSFFAKSLRTQKTSEDSIIRVYWLTSHQSLPLLRFNPYIDVLTTDLSNIIDIKFDEIYSLDDEVEVLSAVAKLQSKKVIGASLESDSTRTYCDRSALWFDMGLLSRFGKDRADGLKRLNAKTHSEIFRDVFQVDNVDFSFYNSECLNSNLCSLLQNLAEGQIAIGLNAFAGSRWMSKGLPKQEFPKLVQALSDLTIFGKPVHLFLIGSGSDFYRNQDFVNSNDMRKNITALNTDGNVLDLAAAIRSLKLLITTDSLCLHLAVAQQVPTVSFFTPTSAAEIESLPYIRKLKSLSEDYCSYRPDADNSTITAERIMSEVNQLLALSSHA
jgi:heptosyltransferase-2